MVIAADYADELSVLMGLVARKRWVPRHSLRLAVGRLALAIFLALILSVFFFNRYVYRGFGLGVYLFRQGNPDLPFIALSFDDGPDPSVTLLILDTLREHGVRATFFMVGRNVEAYPELARSTTRRSLIWPRSIA